MSRSLNKAILIGNLGADPEIRSTTSGNRVAQLSLATNRRWTDAQGETQERTEWHRIVVWGKLVEVVERWVKKGDRVYVEGEIQYRSYEDKEGVTRYSTEINARDLMMLGGREDDAGRERGADAAEPAAAKKPARAERSSPAERAVALPGYGGEEDDLPF